MSKIIGKSGVDWSKAPDGATHYKHNLFYRQHLSVWECHNDYWLKSSHVDSWFKDAVSKEEDLGMNSKKEDKTVADLDIGIFVKWPSSSCCYVFIDKDTLLSFETGNKFHKSVGFTDESLAKAYWSYTYNGEYTPIVKESEADIKIKELEETIALAQKQLQEYKEMK